MRWVSIDTKEKDGDKETLDRSGSDSNPRHRQQGAPTSPHPRLVHREVPVTVNVPIINTHPEEDIPMSDGDSDSDVNMSGVWNANKMRFKESRDGFVFPMKTTKVTTLTPTPKTSLLTSDRYQDLPPAIDYTPKQPPAEPKSTPIHTYTPDY